MKLVREILYEKFTEDSDPIEDLNIGIVDKLNKIISELWREHVLLIYGEKIKISENGKEFKIRYATMHFQYKGAFEKLFNDMLIKNALDKYLLFPPKYKRNIYTSTKIFVYNVKPEYWGLFKALKKEYVYIK
jgi:hypothetical protein